MRAPMAERLHSFGTSIFTTISALATEHGAVNLGQGFPDFAGPELPKRAAIAAITADHNQYAPAPGLPQLRATVAQTYEQLYGLAFDPAREVTITSGATEALLATMLAVVNPGDEVIIFEPAYDAYGPDIAMAGGRSRPVALHPPVDAADPVWRWDEAELRAAFGPRTRAVIVNTPHNPTGKVFDAAELALLAELCQAHDVIAITDEVYDQLVFVGAHQPLAGLPGMRERTVTINSTGKSFSLTGWKIGYVLAPPPLTDAVRRAHQFVTFATATPLQWGIAAAVADALTSDYYAQLRRFYAEQRATLLAMLDAAGLAGWAPQGAYFVVAALPGSWDDDAAFCRWLITGVGVAAIPVSVFYSDPAQARQLVRFCFAKSPATLAAAQSRLAGLSAAAERR